MWIYTVVYESCLLPYKWILYIETVSRDTSACVYNDFFYLNKMEAATRRRIKVQYNLPRDGAGKRFSYSKRLNKTKQLEKSGRAAPLELENWKCSSHEIACHFPPKLNLILVESYFLQPSLHLNTRGALFYRRRDIVPVIRTECCLKASVLHTKRPPYLMWDWICNGGVIESARILMCAQLSDSWYSSSTRLLICLNVFSRIELRI